MRRILDKATAAAAAALAAMVGAVLAVQIATHGVGYGPTVAAVEPFGGAIAGAARSGS